MDKVCQDVENSKSRMWASWVPGSFCSLEGIRVVSWQHKMILSNIKAKKMIEEQTVASKDRDIWQKGQPSWLWLQSSWLRMNLELGSSQSWDPKGGLQKEIPIFPLTAKLGGETTGGMFTENKSYCRDLINRTQAYSGDEQRQHTKNTGPKPPNVQITQSTLWDIWRKYPWMN